MDNIMIGRRLFMTCTTMTLAIPPHPAGGQVAHRLVPMPLPG